MEDELNYDLEEYFQDEPGTETVSASIIDKATPEERYIWLTSVQKELDSLHALSVYEPLTSDDVYPKYQKKGIKVQRISSKLVTTKKPLFDGNLGWKAKAIIC